jgi:WD40 repeat protein
VMNIETRRAFTVGKENSQQSYAFSPDDKYLALTNGAVVELYSLASGKLDHRLSGHGKPTSGLAFTKDGTKLVSASGDVWDMTNPAATDPVVIFDTAADLQQVAVSPDGQVIAGSDGTVWEATGGKKIGRLPGVSGQMARMAFSPDGLFVITQSGGDTLQLWAIGEPGQAGGVTNEIAAAPPEREGITPLNVARIAQLNQLGGGYDGVAFSPEGRTAAGWSRSGVDLLGLAAGEKLFSLGVSGGISNTAYIGGGFLLIAYQRGGVERWDLAEQRLKQSYDATGTALKVSRDGKLFALQGKYIQVVDVLSGKFLYQALGTADSAQDFEFTPDGRYLVVASKQSVNVLDMQDHARQVRVLSTHGADPTSLVFNADGSRLVSASGDVWDLTSTGGKPMATFESTTDVVTISPEGTLILGGDGSLWDAANGQFIGQLAGLEGRLTHAAFTPEGQSILWRTDSGAVMAEGIKSAAQGARVTVSLPDTSRESISAANAARLGLVGWWGKDDLLSLRLLKDAPAGQFTQFDGGQYTGLARHSDGNLLAGVTRAGVELIDLNQAKIVGAFSNFLNVDTILEAAYRGDELMVNKQRAGVERWDLATGELKQRYNVTGASLVVSPDGKRFAIYRDNVVQVLEVESGHVVFSQRAANAQGNFEFSPDGSHLALADGLFVGLWNIETGKREQNLRGHTPRVVGLAFTPEGKKLISASGDIWDLEANKLAAQFDTAATRVAVSPDGQIIAANDGGLWEAATGKRLGTLTEMRGVADQLAFAANGQFLLGQTDKDVIYVWGIRPAPPPVALPSDAQVVVKGNAAGLTRQSLWGRGRLVSGVWSPDDKYLAVNTTENVIVYESDGLKPVRVVWEATALTFNASDQLLIGGAHELQLMEVTSGQVVKTFEQSGHPLQGIQSAAFSPDGKQLGIGGQLKSDGKPDGLAVIDLADGLVGVLKDSLGFGGPVAKIEFAADNNTLVAFTFNPVSLSGVITIWDIQKRGRVREPITNVTKLPTLSPEGKFIAFYDGRILMIQNLLKGGIARGDIHGDGTPHVQTSTTIDPLALITYAYTTDGRVLAFYHTLKANQLAVVRWLIDPTSADVTLQESRYGVDLDNFTGLYADDYTNPRLPLTPAFGLSPGNTRFFSLTADGIVRVWDFQANALAASPADDMELMALSPDGKTAAVPNAVGGIEIVDLASGQAVKTVAGAWYPVKLVYDSASVLAIWHGENQLTFWDLNQNQPIEEYSGERFNNPGFFTLSQDGRLFAVWNRSASKDNLNVFALNSSQPLFDFGRYPKPAPMRFSPDDRYLAVVNNKAVDVWDLQTGQKVTLEGQSKAIGELAFSADGTRLVSATGEIWDVANGKLAATFDVPKELASVALSPNGQVIVGNEGSLWDAATGQPIDVLKNTRGPALSQTFTPDGRQLIRQTQAGVIEVWGINP